MSQLTSKILVKLSFACLAVAASLVATPQLAQAEVLPRVLGLDAAVLVPVGALSSTAGNGNGVGMSYAVFVRYEQKTAPNMSLTARLGGLRGSAKDSGLGSWALDAYSALVGGVYRLQPSSDGIFLSGEVGANMVQFRAPNTTQNSTGAFETKLGAVLGAGYRTDVLTFRAALNLLDVSKAQDTMGVLISVGWDFKGL